MAQPGPYPEEFKQRAVQLVHRWGTTPAQVARDPGCSGESVRNWVRQAEIEPRPA